MFICRPFIVYLNVCAASSFSHPVNDLFNGVQANDAGAFLVGSCIPGFTLYGREMDRVTASSQHMRQTTINTGCAPIRHPCSVQLSTPINRAVKHEIIISVQERTSARFWRLNNKDEIRTAANSCNSLWGILASVMEIKIGVERMCACNCM